MRTYDYAWQKVRKRILLGAQVCHLCGDPLDFDAPARSPLSPSVDHVFPVSAMRGMDSQTRRRLLVDESLLRPVHLRCNSSRGNGRRDRPRHTSRDWR